MVQKEEHSAAREFDQFYTEPGVAKTCISFAKDVLAHLEFERFVEPSAGTGAFSSQLGSACIALDIDPKQEGIIQADFLEWQPSESKRPQLVIGNPPFGKNASLAVRFFNHAAGFAGAIAFIVPRSFRKASIQNRLDQNFHLVASLPLPENSFLFGGKPYPVPCDFQVWERRNELRPVEKLQCRHSDFEFCQREEADFAVQRIGANAGRIKDVADAGSKSSHYFIRATGAPDDLHDLRNCFEQLDFDAVRLNTAGNPSIAKSELVALYARELAQEDGDRKIARVEQPSEPCRIGSYSAVLKFFQKSASCFPKRANVLFARHQRYRLCKTHLPAGKITSTNLNRKFNEPIHHHLGPDWGSHRRCTQALHAGPMLLIFNDFPPSPRSVKSWEPACRGRRHHRTRSLFRDLSAKSNSIRRGHEPLGLSRLQS